jgi:hypothetical protein
MITWPVRTSGPVSGGSAADGSRRASSERAQAEREVSARANGSAEAITKGLIAIEISAPATTRFMPSGGTSPSEALRPARMNEKSPI